MVGVHNYTHILIPGVSTNSCGSIVVEEHNFLSIQLWVLWVQYWLAFWRLNVWSPKSCVTVFMNHLTSTMNPSSNIVIEEHKLSFVQRVQCHLHILSLWYFNIHKYTININKVELRYHGNETYMILSQNDILQYY